jgi:hypothetical protein
VNIVQLFGEGGTHQSVEFIAKVTSTDEKQGSTKLLAWLKVWADAHPDWFEFHKNIVGLVVTELYCNNCIVICSWMYKNQVVSERCVSGSSSQTWFWFAGTFFCSHTNDIRFVVNGVASL